MIFVASAWGVRHGGINAFNTELAQAVAQLGDDRTIGCAVLSSDRVDEERARDHGVELISLDDGQHERWSADQAEPLVRGCAPLGEVEWWVGHDAISGAVCVAAAELTGARVAVIQHTDYSAYGAIKRATAETIHERRFAEHALLDAADVVFGVGPKLTNAARDRLRRSSDRPVHELIPGLASIAPYLTASKRFQAITIGRFDSANDPVKQGRLAIHAFARLIKDVPDVTRRDPQITVLGIEDAAAEAQLRQFASQKGGRLVQVIARPFLESRSELFDLLADSTVCLVLSTHDGFGLTGWEAIAAQVPLIVSINTGLYEFLDSLGGEVRGCVRPVDIRGAAGGVPYAKGDVREVTRQLRQIALDQGAAARRDAQTLREKLCDFTWQRTAQQLLTGLGIPWIAADPPPMVPDTPRPALLPVREDSFRGHADLLARCIADVETGHERLVTVTGAPGAGKTRFAYELARRLREHFADRVYLVDLVRVDDPNLVIATISKALQLDAPEPLLDALTEFFRGQRALIVLDNFDHVRQAAPLIGRLLSAVPGLVALATAQAPLRITGESARQLKPLDIEAATALFHDRTDEQYSGPEFAEDVEALSEQLGGLPLAIELLASRAEAFTPAELREIFAGSLLHLKHTRQDIAENQRSLRAAFDWTYDLLMPEQRQAFERLSVFEGGWNTTSGHAVCGVEQAPDVFADQLKDLCERSLISRDLSGTGSRYLMLDVLRRYATERLAEHDAAAIEMMRGRHARYFLDLAVYWDQRTEQSSLQIIAAFTAEAPNLTAALDYFLQQGDVAAALRLANAAGRSWWSRDYAEAYRRLGQVLALPVSDQHPDELRKLRASVLIRFGMTAIRQAALTEAASAMEEAFAIAESLDDRPLMAQAASSLALVDQDRAKNKSARRRLKTAQALLTRNDVRERADCLDALAIVATEAGRYAKAHRLLDQAEKLYASATDEQDVAWVHTGRAEIFLLEGENVRAAEIAQEALDVAAGRDPGILSWASNRLGLAASALGDVTAAKAAHEISLRTATLLGNTRPRLIAIEGFAVLAARMGRPETAAELRSCVDTRRQKTGLPRTPAEAKLLAPVDDAIATLSVDTRQRCVRSGVAMTLEQAAARARAL